MNVVRVLLGFAVASVVVTTQPVLSAVNHPASSVPEGTYILRVERGKSHKLRFEMIDPRGDGLIEADEFDLVLSPRGLTIKPTSPSTASSLSGTRVNFETFELFLPTDGSDQSVEGTLAK
jgi:hypothetical protein